MGEFQPGPESPIKWRNCSNNVPEKFPNFKKKSRNKIWPALTRLAQTVLQWVVRQRSLGLHEPQPFLTPAGRIFIKGVISTLHAGNEQPGVSTKAKQTLGSCLSPTKQISMDTKTSRAYLVGMRETKVKYLGNSLSQVCGEDVLEKLGNTFGSLPGNLCNY